MADSVDKEFYKKLIHELHDISLSLRVLSGRNVTSENSKAEKRTVTYAERYLARSNKESTTDDSRD